MRGLQARGYAVEGITFSRQYPALLFPGKTQYETDEMVNPVAARRLLDTINPVSWYRTAGHVIRSAPDAVIFQYWMSFFAPSYTVIARRARKAGVKVLAVVHNALPHERRPGDLMLSRRFFRDVQGCIVMSDAVAQDLRRLGVAAPIQQIAHPVYDLFGSAVSQSDARAYLDLPPERPVLLFFGFVRRYKGLHVLLEAMPHVIEALPEVCLVVAGEFYEDEASHRKLVAQHGLEEHVCFHSHYIPKVEVSRYFCAADVVVQPYVSATQSGVAQVAFHYDKPVIVTDVGGLAEVVPHERAGLVVPPEDPRALAAAVVRFFNEEMADDLTEGVRHEKHKFSWDRLYEAVEDLLG